MSALSLSQQTVTITQAPTTPIQASPAPAQKQIPLWAHLLTLPISSQVTSGLARIFNLEILTHGTSFPNYLGILTNGGDPSKGGSKTGSTVMVYSSSESESQKVKDHFYVFKDTEIPSPSRAQGLLYSMVPSLLTRMHVTLSGISPFSGNKSRLGTAEKIIYGAANLFFCPTLKFTYSKEEIPSIFENDPDYCDLAYRTTQKLPNDRIGLIGVCFHASLEGFKQGLQTHPLRVLSGVVQLAVGAALTYYGYGLIT